MKLNFNNTDTMSIWMAFLIQKFWSGKCDCRRCCLLRLLLMQIIAEEPIRNIIDAMIVEISNINCDLCPNLNFGLEVTVISAYLFGNEFGNDGRTMIVFFISSYQPVSFFGVVSILFSMNASIWRLSIKLFGGNASKLRKSAKNISGIFIKL